MARFFKFTRLIIGLLLLGGFVGWPITSGAQINFIKNEVFFFNQSWHTSNKNFTWQDLTIDFNNTQPVGRLALAQGELLHEQGLVGQTLSPVYFWQFLDQQPIELIKVKLQLDNPDQLTPAVYLNTNGIWQKVSNKPISAGQIEFNIQSLQGKFVVLGAEPGATSDFELPLSSETVAAGYTVDTLDKKVRIGLMPQTLDQEVTVKIRELPGHYSAFYLSDNLSFASSIYHIWLDSPVPLKFSRNYPIEIEFFPDNDELKNIYYFDPVNNNWHPSPSTSFYDLGRVRTVTFQAELILAVVADPSKKEQGIASWFPSALTPRNIYGCANNDYPFGTMLRVTNLANDKFFDTEVISRGPYVDFRIIDLTSEAFKKISTLGSGVIDVKIEPLDLIVK